MKNLFKLSSLLFVGLVLFQISCKDDPAPVVDPLVGKWAISSATFNSTSVAPTDTLMIAEFPLPTGGTFTLKFAAGESILDIIVGAMADNVCDNPASYPTFFLELTTDGKLLLSCPDEQNSGVDTGTWFQNGNVITLTVVTAAGNLPITFNNFAMLTDGSKFTGQSANFPMTQTFGVDLGPTNLQTLNIDMEFTRLP
jgi:hypothetical protein